MLEVRIRPRAQLDLESIYLHIAVSQDRPAAADKVLDEIYHAIALTAEFPERGQAYRNESLEHTYQKVLVGNYWVFYTSGEELDVWRVLHARRDIDDATLADLSVGGE